MSSNDGIGCFGVLFLMFLAYDCGHSSGNHKGYDRGKNERPHEVRYVDKIVEKPVVVYVPTTQPAKDRYEVKESKLEAESDR